LTSKLREKLVGVVVLLSVLVGVPAAGALGDSSESSILTDSVEPVVFTGADLVDLVGAPPDEIVAFRYDGAWIQVPVQVDERTVLEYSQIYNGASGEYGVYGLAYDNLVYTDPDTYTGADPDPTFDVNDELVFMARDMGSQVTTYSFPDGVVTGSGVEIAVRDPVTDEIGYLYLFRTDDGLDPGAGVDYVTYDFNLLSGDYKDTYVIPEGQFNPEQSVVTSAYYEKNFSDRWINDGLRLTSAGATGVDILDRHKSLFAPDECGRSEKSFSKGEGAFIANKDGPVRAIRSYIGANSGPLTERIHFFYEQKEVLRTHLRVHFIPLGMLDFYDYSPEATGMIYYNANNLDGITIDGVPDSHNGGFIDWELTAGTQGSIAMVYSIDTNMDLFQPGSYYLDDSTPTLEQCTGDSSAFGASGLWINHYLDNTDPNEDLIWPAKRFNAQRDIYYLGPDATTDDALQHRQQVNNPFVTHADPFPAPENRPVVELSSVAGSNISESLPITWTVSNISGPSLTSTVTAFQENSVVVMTLPACTNLSTALGTNSCTASTSALDNDTHWRLRLDVFDEEMSVTTISDNFTIWHAPPEPSLNETEEIPCETVGCAQDDPATETQDANTTAADDVERQGGAQQAQRLQLVHLLPLIAVVVAAILAGMFVVATRSRRRLEEDASTLGLAPPVWDDWGSDDLDLWQPRGTITIGPARKARRGITTNLGPARVAVHPRALGFRPASVAPPLPRTTISIGPARTVSGLASDNVIEITLVSPPREEEVNLPRHRFFDRFRRS